MSTFNTTYPPCPVCASSSAALRGSFFAVDTYHPRHTTTHAAIAQRIRGELCLSNPVVTLA